MLDADRSPCRLLLAIPELDRGGPDRIFFELARRLDRQEFALNVAVVDPRGFYLDQLPPDVDVHVLGLTDRRLSDRYPILRFRDLVRRVKPQVVLSTLRMNWPAAVARTGGGIGLVSRVPNHVTATIGGQAKLNVAKARLTQVIQTASLRRADFVVSQSNAMARDLKEVGIRPDRIVTITNPIDPAWVAERLRSGERVTLPGRPRLLSVGRLEPQKGYDVLIRALPKIRLEFPELHLTLVGTGSQAGSLNDLCEELGVCDAVTFIASLDNPFPYYADADLLVAPSRWEGLSNVVIESLMVGLPVTTTTGPAAGEDLIVSDDFGRLAEPGDVDGLVSAVCDALTATFDRPMIAARAAEQFGSDSVIRAYAELLLCAARPDSTARRGSREGVDGYR